MAYGWKNEIMEGNNKGIGFGRKFGHIDGKEFLKCRAILEVYETIHFLVSAKQIKLWVRGGVRVG